MPIIKDQKLAEDPYRRIDADDELPTGPVLVDLSTFAARREELLRHSELGVIVPSDVLLDEILEDLEHLTLIALDFPHFKDGRSYTKARQLRERYGFEGELRAIGDVLVDQLFFMHRCGFDAFELAESVDPEDALAAFARFSVLYQPGADEPRPLFRRAARPGPTDDLTTP
jgi:uncharacterized protein (DUF934 family)